MNITWRNKAGTQCSQIDYIFTTANCRSSSRPVRDTGLESDHYPLVGEIYLGNGNAKVTRRIKSYGWKGWTLESDLGKFQSDALRNCGFESGFPTENFEEIAVKSSLKIVESGIKTAVMNSEFFTAGLQQWRRRQLPEELRRMREGLWYLENEERKEKTKEFMKKKKEWTQEFKILDLRRMASNRAFQIFIPPSTFDIDGISTGDGGVVSWAF